MSKNTKKSIRIATLAVFIGVFAFLTFGQAAASSITAKNIIKLVNGARTGEGLKPLEENSKLSAAASAKAEDMLKNDYFSHNSPDGKTPWYWIEKSGYDYKYAGENLAMNFISAEDEQKAWMKSPTHRKNILNDNYQEIGVAVAEGKIDGKTTTVAVQIFGSRPDFVASSKRIGAETEAVVLGDEESNLVPVESQGGLPENVFIKDLFPEEAARQGVTTYASGKSLWATFQEKLSPENRPALTLLALKVLWVILIGNILFLVYSFGRKILLSVKKDSENSGEQKIPVEDLEEEHDVSVAVKIHILNIAK
jgi:uncharacterized protein YkwD